MSMVHTYTAGITACSNGLPEEKKEEIHLLADVLGRYGVSAVMSRYLYERSDGISGSGRKKAEELMRFFENPGIRYIFDVSGGDMANEVLGYLDYQKIRESRAVFWGYSDLTVILNAIYAETGKVSVLYQIRNLLYDHGEEQQKRFSQWEENETADLFALDGRFVQGHHMEGTVVGGNIRCFLELAGTPNFPDFNDKILFLEARSGQVPQMTTFFSQLQQTGAFDKIKGLILGTFTQMETVSKDIVPLALRYVKDNLPVFRTLEAGHGTDSKAVIIGGQVTTVSESRIRTQN